MSFSFQSYDPHSTCWILCFDLFYSEQLNHCLPGEISIWIIPLIVPFHFQLSFCLGFIVAVFVKLRIIMLIVAVKSVQIKLSFIVIIVK